MSISAPLRFYLFGPFQIESETGPVHLPTHKVEALLAYLVLHPQPHTREKLAALLWGDFADMSASARIRCTAVTGSFTMTVVGGPACTSPIGLCTRSTLTGDLAGTYDAVFDSLVPAGDPTDPTLMVYTGHSVITLDRGQIFGQDTGFIRLNPAGPSPFQTTVRAVDGTHRFNKVSGGILVIGGLDLFSSGTGAGTYSGEICNK